MGKAWRSFWRWYERHYALNVGIAAGLFCFQLVHLFWLAAHVVMGRVFGVDFFELRGVLKGIIIAVDYTEIPSLIGISLVYWNELRKGFDIKSAAYLIFLNSQWLHLFWITDEFVLSAVHGRAGAVLPAWLAWVAIGIDYLELPVIFDTLKKAVPAVFSDIRRSRFLTSLFSND